MLTGSLIILFNPNSCNYEDLMTDCHICGSHLRSTLLLELIYLGFSLYATTGLVIMLIIISRGLPNTYCLDIIKTFSICYYLVLFEIYIFLAD